MDLKTASIRTVSTSLTATAALALVASPAHAQDYVVQPGDTVSAIAQGHGTTVSTIVASNGLNARATIYAGQHLTLPDGPAAVPVASAPTTYVVAKGDTLWGIANGFHTSVSAIQRANGMADSTLIRIGEALTIPGGAGTPTGAAATPAGTYVVKPGDTLWSIAHAFGTSVSAIAQLNGVANSSLIRVDQPLTIPAGATAPVVATPGTSTAMATPPSTYVVVRGDTLSSIAARRGTSVSAIASANALANPSIIRVGQVLTIPGGVPSGLVGDTFLGRTYPADVVASANVNKATLNSMDVPTRVQMQQLVIDTANAMGVDPALAQAIAFQESGFNMRAVSPANAIGCMQVIPASGEWASGLVGRDLNLLVAKDNVTAGVAILKQLQRNGTPVETAIAGYYQGERSVRERGLNPDTKKYVASVVALIERFE
ncbi:MAG: LysM peptidoglycan-binding domain-containing protein [Demequinaceae bacterium]|nr:LysM peptidoglycan-binding domain-containing protein [Demequinaceae bacterium]